MIFKFGVELEKLNEGCCCCQPPDLGQGLEFDFTFANNNENNENNPHLNFPGWDGTRGLKFGTQT